MAFRIRRGTDTDRLSITPSEGELLYTTDTGNIFVGDGTTIGGNLVTTSLLDETSPELSADLDLGGNNIVGTGNINIAGTITATGDINLGDGAEDNVIVGGQIQSSLFPSTDNTYDLGAASSTWKAAYFSNFYGNFVDSEDNLLIDGDTGDATLGSIVGDSFTGSVFNDDSSIAIDGITGNINTTTIVAPNALTITTLSDGANDLRILAQQNAPQINLIKQDAVDLAGDVNAYGRLVFSREDINGEDVGSLITGNDFRITQGVPLNGNFESSNFCTWTGTGLGVGKLDANETLDVEGNAVATGFVQFGSFTTTERDAIAAANGMVIYNTTDDKFQGYQNNVWINLDGS
jgi:hypothetical protein